jgi:hypothetical protein
MQPTTAWMTTNEFVYSVVAQLAENQQAHTSDLLEDARQQENHFQLLVKPVLPVQLLSEIDQLEDEPAWRPDAEAQVGIHIARVNQSNKSPLESL